MHFFTSITTNYLPKARVLAKSLKQHHPDAVFHLMLSDNPPDRFNMEDEPFDSLITIDELDIENLDSWIFQHSVVELCTAVKGHVFSKLFQTTNAEKIFYFDPDMAILHDLNELFESLEKSSVVLTPHLVDPEEEHEAILDNEICSLKHGIYNIGFLGIRRSSEGLRFMEWWRNRLHEFCFDDIPGGLFTDQRWVDLAPALFEGIRILRDKQYNVATWNLNHRKVYKDNQGKFCIDGSPIKFYHFSGFDSGAQEAMLDKYAGNNTALRELRQWYSDALKMEGQQNLGNSPCVYSFYSNGDAIPDRDRKLYRSRLDLINTFKNPSKITGDHRCYYSWLKDAKNREEMPVVSEAEIQLAEILNSTSWKVTRPLRTLATTLRKKGILPAAKKLGR